MAKENPDSELIRLFREQQKALEDEVFGGMSPRERKEYDKRTKRINVLEIELAASRVARKSSQPTKADQGRQWSKYSETDTPQSEARQPYRSREDYTDASAASRRKRAKGKNESDEKGSA